MKKIVGILAALSLVAGVAFADDPSVVPSVASFSGNASIEYDIDLNDPVKMGIVNDASTEFKITFVPKDFTKSTEGDGLWGELVIKTGAEAHEQGIGSVYTVPSVSVDTAKIHFTDDDFFVVMDIKAPGLSVGGGKYSIATWSDNDKWANPGASVTLTKKAGFTLNFGLKDTVEFNLQYADNGVVEPKAKKVAFVFDASLKAVENLGFYAGVGYGTEVEKLVAAVKADYKLGLTDTLFLKPAVGFALNEKEAKNLGLAVLFGWGGENLEPNFAKFKAAAKVDDSDEWDNVVNKTADGVSVAANIALADPTVVELLISAYDSTLVDGLKLGAQMYVPNASKFADLWIADAAVAWASGDLFGDWKVSANFGLEAISAKVADKSETKTGFLWGFGIENGAIIDNTTLYVKYNGQKAKDIGSTKGHVGKDDNGTIKIGAKISF